MKIKVLVKPNAKRSKVESTNDVYIVHVDAPPIKGKANKRLIEILAKYFGVPKSRIKIIHGHNSREKLIEIL